MIEHNKGNRKTWDLRPEDELRFEVAFGSSILLKLVDGTAEINGTELAGDTEYVFKDIKTHVFTWSGCQILIEGTCQAYVANDTQMKFYLNIHHVLQSYRQKARQDAKKSVHGPRVLVVAPTDSGKSTLCSILTNYAARLGEKVTLVDLDVGQNSLTIPGTLSACVIDKPQLSVDTYGQCIPLTYFYGSVSPGDNQKLYITQMQNLANALLQRDQMDPDVLASGWIVNTCGWVDGAGLKLIYAAIATFVPSVILIISYDKLYHSISTYLNEKTELSHAQVINVPKSPGVVIRDTEWRKATRDAKVREYFYGAHREYLPRNIVVPFSKVSIYKVIQKPIAPMSAMPIGHQAQEEALRVVTVTPTQHAILAVSRATSEDTIISSNVAGFLRVIDVNQEKNFMKCLAPNLDDLPGTFLIMSNLKFTDSSS
ncbi:protein CLP1 homolog [Schistocerca gregaria]|uniref:protein CLP1 homolog n=1 Tax=Schistocerca gregaria TaxID=7010 RepID=UPI00211DB848|nr:protein CLP1 homolog [Schistocerca gregaria]